ncbi:hypothetical protein Q5H91_09035 [Sphingomonas sp. KR1UV-12]|uniref:DUF11 domain-containing protein n=1 Tax=Sphingomonas aurea TaxID=3063994 RepID=A0ABT9EK85_9SPHN|nr:hypothetical protein [Sphingomonas sp. KR1UV-12]MDP1027356.1 hypothetical protein [Sphingomonas sp. KR1UV-12]
MSIARRLALAAALIGLAPAVPAGGQVARVENTATLSFGTTGARQAVQSNTVAMTVERSKVATSLSFRLPPPGYRMSGMACDAATHRFTPAPIDAATLAASPPAVTLEPQAAMIFVLDNPGGNHDPTAVEGAWISVSSGNFSGRIELMETGVDTGVFAGGLPPIGTHPELSACDPSFARGSRLVLSFHEDDYSLASTSATLIDPAGYVFDSTTGALIDGATVTLLDDQDRPAIVYGEDGVSRYPSTVVSGDGAQDASGRRYRFAQGNYRFPLVAAGTYHLRIVPPGSYTAPSVQDPAVLAALRDPSGRPFLINPASFSGRFTLSNPDPFFADIPLDRHGDTVLLLTKTASVREASPGDFVQFRVTLENRGDAPVSGIHLTDIMPAGLRYEHGSARGSEQPLLSADGRNLDFALPTVAARSSVDVSYVMSVAPGAKPGEAVNRVLASGSAGATANEASASVRIRPLLFTDGFSLIGRVTAGACNAPAAGRRGIAGVRLMLEDGTFVVTDRDGLYHVEGIRPGRHVVQLDTATMPAAYEPVACDDDTRQAGSAISRFVESQGGLLKRVDFQLRPTGRAVAAEVLPITVASDAAAAGGDRDWFAGQQPGIAMLFPQADHNPRSPAVRVVIKHAPGQRVALSINGALSDPIAFDATDRNAEGTIAISRWSGLPLAVGDNRIEARVLGADGQVVETLTRSVHVAGVAAHVTAMPDLGRLVADGVTRPLIAVRVTDRAGRPVRAGTLVPYQVARPYAPALDVALEQARRQDAGAVTPAATARVVGDDGVAFIALQPTTQAGNARVTVSLTDDTLVRTTELRAWLAASAKDWTVVGFGAGTFGYDMLQRHGRPMATRGAGEVHADGQLALYAKGRIRGSWLATIAYDSDRRRDRSRGLLGTIDPDRYYTVYGDGSQQAYDAPTAGKLYLRLERREFYALFGDFETGLTDTRLGRYSRTLNGAKAAYENGALTFTAFAAHTDERYARDEIAGNGLSGPYRLSARDIVPNSDKLRIEVRDRFRSERIVASTAMTRHIDYDIDPVAGTIRFREPVLTRDAQLNPIFIVVDYESYGTSRKVAAGGRVAARTAGGRVEVGVTALHDDTIGNATVLAVDTRLRPDDTTEIRAEAAAGGRGGLDAGRAWLVEAEHHGSALDVIGYARQQDRGFGVNQQNIVEGGTRKLGLDGRVRLTDRVSLTGTAWHQQQLDSAGRRTALDARLEWRRATGSAFIGTQWAMDRGLDGEDRDSRLLTLGGTQALMGGRLSLSAQTQVAPGGSKASVDFPVRHQITAAYRLRPGIRLIGGYEIADGKDFTARTAQFGFDVAPWTGAKLMSTLNQQGISENAGRTFAQYGLSQSLPLGRNWTVDATLDASSTVRGRIAEGAAINAFQPVASGGSLSQGDRVNGDYAAVTLGAAFRAARWSWNGRAEYRDGGSGNRFGITSNALRSLGEGRTLASSLRWYQVRQDNGAIASSATADLALAWRPLDSRWSLLDRLQFRKERADAGFTDRNVLGVPAIGGSYQASLRAINNLALNYRSGDEGVGHGVEATVYYGAKWVRGKFGGDEYTGYVDVTGAEFRLDIAPSLDIGVQASAQHAWSRHALKFSVGPMLGVSPAKNLWFSVGYNISGYRDRDFSAERQTRAGPYVTLRLKFDQTLFGVGRAGR